MAEIKDAHRLLKGIQFYHCSHPVCHCPDRRRTKFYRYRYAGRTDRDEGYLRLRINPWIRKTITRFAGHYSAIIVIYAFGGEQSGQPADLQPGDPEHATGFCCYSADPFH